MQYQESQKLQFYEIRPDLEKSETVQVLIGDPDNFIMHLKRSGIPVSGDKKGAHWQSGQIVFNPDGYSTVVNKTDLKDPVYMMLLMDRCVKDPRIPENELYSMINQIISEKREKYWDSIFEKHSIAPKHVDDLDTCNYGKHTWGRDQEGPQDWLKHGPMMEPVQMPKEYGKDSGI